MTRCLLPNKRMYQSQRGRRSSHPGTPRRLATPFPDRAAAPQVAPGVRQRPNSHVSL